MLRLPQEIQVDIFLRLPAKSILRCRCVCKPLCRLLYNPKFIKDHLHRNKKKPNLMLISNVLHRPHQFFPVDYASILSASSASVLSTKCTCDGAIRKYNGTGRGWADEVISVVGSCNGLICINSGSGFGILNPSTGEYNWVFFSNLPITYTYGFGYDCHLDVYKLITIGKNTNHSYSKVEVCALRGNRSWKTIRTLNRYSFLPEGPYSQFVWFLNGALHWKGFIEAAGSWVIVSLDMNTDTFVEYAYPEGVKSQRGYSFQSLQMYDHLGILDDRLCLVVCDARKRNNSPWLRNRDCGLLFLIDVWLMQDYGVSESWIKRYSLKPSCNIKLPRGKLVWSSSTKDGEVLLLIDGGYRKLLYDPKNDSIKFLEVPNFETGDSLLVSYVDSLVSIRSRTTDAWERNAMKSSNTYARKESAKKQRQKMGDSLVNYVNSLIRSRTIDALERNAKKSSTTYVRKGSAKKQRQK